MDTQAVIAHLNEILKHEWTGVAQYSQASFIVEGIWREVFAEKFEGDAMYTEALRLAEGNRPLEVFLEDILLSEQEGVEEYTKLLRDTKAAADSSTARIAESA